MLKTFEGARNLVAIRSDVIAVVHFLFLLLFSSSLDGAADCPKSCDQVDCVTAIVNQTYCPEGTTYQENMVVCGCCPACVKFLSPGEPCLPERDLVDVSTRYQSVGGQYFLDSNTCAPGLSCDGTCNPDPDQCFSYQYQNEVLTRPSCDPNGDFAPVQCKGDFINGRCFCYGKKGKRIFGSEWWTKASNMTCACSREVEEILDKNLRTDVSLHCSPEGNYEELQCDDGLCWCSEPQTGIPVTTIVPETMMIMLPCYSEDSDMTVYMRECESISVAVNRIRDISKKHGSSFSATLDSCDADGSYSAVQIIENQAHCAKKNKDKIGSYQLDMSERASMNCYCARDALLYDENDLIFYLDCGATGNYKELQSFEGTQTFCVDQDGYPTTETGDIKVCPKWASE